MHKTVLLQETVNALLPQNNGIYLDGTLNSGGHSVFLSKLLKGNCTIVGFDADGVALQKGVDAVKKTGAKVFGIESNFKNIKKYLDDLGILKINGAMFDLGLSSDQLEDSGRGFSFQKNEPLLMTFKSNPTKEDLTAKDVVNSFSLENLDIIIKAYGEESFSKRIAKAICEAREIKPIQTSEELREIIWNAVPVWYRRRKIHPATKTFQAIRVVVNDEIQSLIEGLSATFERLSSGGRIAVISFESVSDREVKQFFKNLSVTKKAKLVVKKPITPSREEQKENPRSRSSKLRIIEKI